MTPLTELWQSAITWLATHAVTPTVHWLGIAQVAGDPRDCRGGTDCRAAVVADCGRDATTGEPDSGQALGYMRLTTVDHNYTLLMLLGHAVRPVPVHQ
ncbi:hypothetical protein [Delftia deserti]|uniref:Uncharacterized protein n=1 Tax=Delftia deserti TaxID=1651218 RepID=A0ABW5EU95_9BURK